jgi:hypothetical protein
VIAILKTTPELGVVRAVATVEQRDRYVLGRMAPLQVFEVQKVKGAAVEMNVPHVEIAVQEPLRYVVRGELFELSVGPSGHVVEEHSVLIPKEVTVLFTYDQDWFVWPVEHSVPGERSLRDVFHKRYGVLVKGCHGAAEFVIGVVGQVLC